MSTLTKTIEGVQEILVICPCCGDIFRLVDGKLVFPKKPPKACEYLSLVGLENKFAREDDLLSSSEFEFDEALNAQRHQLTDQGRKQAKQSLKEIDPIFSGAGVDPQDVKVIFDPVEYVVFHGLASESGVQFIEFISRSPNSKRQEALIESISKTIKNGDVEFETLRMRNDGSFDVEVGGVKKITAKTIAKNEREYLEEPVYDDELDSMLAEARHHNSREN